MDSFVWRRDVEDHSVKSAHFRLSSIPVMDEGYHLELDCYFALKFVWKSLVPSKIQIFGWRLHFSKLQTKDALVHRGVFIGAHDLVCPFCLRQEESHSHLFLLCPISMRVWYLTRAWLGLGGVPQCDSLLDHLLAWNIILKGRIKKNLCLLFWVSVSWATWLRRNHIIFKDGLKEAKDVFSLVKSLVWEWFGETCKFNVIADFSVWASISVSCIV
ncbi:uncharacterized protein LOC127096632 [Lathyrus oleraceus]|uniref:uncharacterized protein LOC127096632 n=1 Tax=Pisum sativum TaxID=3888 RepID=UPI0021CE9E38|nr:uncharacterized protein LOC127096632 [Pisum sativum]